MEKQSQSGGWGIHSTFKCQLVLSEWAVAVGHTGQGFRRTWASNVPPRSVQDNKRKSRINSCTTDIRIDLLFPLLV